MDGYAVAAAEGITVIEWPLVFPILGIYIRSDLIRSPIIVLTPTLTPRLRKIVLEQQVEYHRHRVGTVITPLGS